jgi:hypothetical protein
MGGITMAEKAKDKKKVTLIDGTEIAVQPLKISLLKPFMKKFAELTGVAEDNEKSMDVLLECVQIALKQYSPELAEDREKIEDNIDLPTVYDIIDAASGIQLGDSASLLNI